MGLLLHDYDPCTLFSEDFIYATQLTSVNWTPVQKLCWAILADVAFIVTRPEYRDQYVADTQWLTAQTRKPFSFQWICATLQIDDQWCLRKFQYAMNAGKTFHKSKNREWQKSKRKLHDSLHKRVVG